MLAQTPTANSQQPTVVAATTRARLYTCIYARLPVTSPSGAGRAEMGAGGAHFFASRVMGTLTAAPRVSSSETMKDTAKYERAPGTSVGSW